MRNPKIEFDQLQMYFGEPYCINLDSAEGTIVLHQPTIGDIVKLGEKTFNTTLNIFITNTTAHRLELWNNGIDWNEISDFYLFCMLYKGIDYKASYLIFKEIDFSDFEPIGKKIDNVDTIVLYNEKLNIEINEEVYHHICQYLRNVFNTFPEEKITHDNIMKQWFINKDERQLKIEKEKAEKQQLENNSIQSLISACVNHPGFKYKLQELREVGVCEFYDSVKRLQIYENATALMKGMYSGMVDSKKINPEDYNFMKKI